VKANSLATEDGGAGRPMNGDRVPLKAPPFTRPTNPEGQIDRRAGGRPLRLAALAAVPSLPEVVADPMLVDQLPRRTAIEYQRVVRRLDADLGARIAIGTDAGAEVGRTPEDPDRAVGLDEAAHVLGMEKRTLERKPTWQRLAGYKDVDGRVKFRLADLRRHIARRSANGGRG
jgi:hypothetical protein